MMLVMALHLIGLSVAFSSSLASPLPLHISLEGSAEQEESLQLGPTPSLYSTIGSASEHPTTPVGSSHVEHPTTPGGSSHMEHPTTPGGPSHMDKVFLDQVVDFLEENLLLICVGSAFLILILLIVCGAVLMSRRRKVNAYYPSSFPSKMYVDQRDKTGGTKLFNEVPEKPANSQQSQQTDSGKQLQADIMRAAKKLRTPTKTPPGEREGKEVRTPTKTPPGEREGKEVRTLTKTPSGEGEGKEVEPSPAADQSPEAGLQEHGSIPDTDTSHEGKELYQVSDRETAAGTRGPEEPVTPPEPDPEPAGLEQDESAQSPSGPGPSQKPAGPRALITEPQQ